VCLRLSVHPGAAPRRAVGLGKRKMVSAIFETHREDDQVKGKRQLTGGFSLGACVGWMQCCESSPERGRGREG
jgi:hypothetical protein